MVCLNPKKQKKKLFYHTKENKNYFLTVNNNQAEARKIFMEFGILFLSSENELFSHSFVLYFFYQKRCLLTYIHLKYRNVGRFLSTPQSITRHVYFYCGKMIEILTTTI